MSLSNQNDGYRPEGSKIICNTCGSILSKTSWSSHIKTKKHLGEPSKKEGEKYQKMRQTSSTIRQKKIETLGIEKVREIEKLKKQKQRANNKLGIKRIRKEPSDQSEENKKMDEEKNDIKATEAEIKNLPKKEKIQYNKIINEARASSAKNILTIPETKKIVVEKVQRLKDDLIGIKNCKSLINKLDHKNLTNIKGKIEHKTMLPSRTIPRLAIYYLRVLIRLVTGSNLSDGNMVPMLI